MTKSQAEQYTLWKVALGMIQELKKSSQDDNLHLIIPLLVRVISRSNYNEQKVEINFKIDIVKTIEHLIKRKSFKEYVATIVHTMINVAEVYQSKETIELYNEIIRLFIQMAT